MPLHKQKIPLFDADFELNDLYVFTQAYSRDLEFFLERYICRKIGDYALKFVSLICAVVVVSHWFACG